MDFYRHLFTGGVGAPVTYSAVYLASIIFTFQVLVTAYSSSTYLEQFVSTETVGILYSISASLAIIFSLTLPRLLRRIGNVASAVLLVCLVSLTQVFMGLAWNTPLVVVAFILYMSISPQVYLNIDIFLETLIGTEEGTTGSKRGLILTLMSVATFMSPLAMGYIVGEENNLANVYFVGAAVGLLFIAFIAAKFRHFMDPEYTTVRLRDMVRDSVQNKDIRTVMTAQFLLQFFYTWAVIYIPLYLATSVGFSWQTISLILATGLFAFVIFEYPIGVMADRRLGEKELMALGFVILAIATASISYMGGFSVTNWMVLMFISRIGASLVEVTTESYFFKKVKGNELTLISLFRLTRPLANLLGALVGSLALFYLPFNFIFLVLALVMVCGAFITSFLTDTK
jgi:MFS family permease